jgi:hypothetical protein
VTEGEEDLVPNVEIDVAETHEMIQSSAGGTNQMRKRSVESKGEMKDQDRSNP